MNKEINKEINWLKEHLYDIYKYEKSFGQDSKLTYDLDIELLNKICRSLSYLQLENKQLNKIIEEINILIKNYKDLCKDKGLYMNLTVSMIEDILKGDSNE